MRADRLLSIMLLLQVHRRLTSRELAARLEVSERTIHRDMEALGVAGVPVVAERGSGGGWSLPQGYSPDLPGLTGAEIVALLLPRPSRLMRDLGLAQAADAARLKLLAALPTTQRDDEAFVRQRIHVDAPGWQPSDEVVPLLPVVQEAIWQERRLRLAYRRGDGGQVERVVDPLGLVAKGNVWYLVAAVEGELRTYRVARVVRAEIADEPCVRPPGFDLAAYWEQSGAEFRANLPRFPVVARVAPEAMQRLRYARYVRILREGAPDAEGWVQATIDFEVEHEALTYALGLGPLIEMLEPVSLRERVREQAELVATLYKQAEPIGR
jgi:predicted DNA-binding transcriptional regulator YafY